MEVKICSSNRQKSASSLLGCEPADALVLAQVREKGEKRRTVVDDSALSRCSPESVAMYVKGYGFLQNNKLSIQGSRVETHEVYLKDWATKQARPFAKSSIPVEYLFKARQRWRINIETR